MSANLLCVLALVATFWATKRSLGKGLVAVAVTGYFYGILRANFINSASHFIFDASLMGLYMAYGSRFFDNRMQGYGASLRLWTALLIAWPCLLAALPFQPLMVSLVGLRGNIFFLPILVIATRLRSADLRQLTLGLAWLNVAALGVGIAEYFLGLESFFPRSAVTMIIYSSGDVAGGFLRIPSLFTSAHAYAGTMTSTLPFLFGAWSQPEGTARRKLVLLSGVFAALCGVLLASTRLNFVIALYFVIIATLSSKLSIRKRALWVVAVVAIGTIALTNDRFQRFKSLTDSEVVMDRIAGSVNRTFLELLTQYPMGNGLGGGGTSMPYFLQGEIQRPIAIESEYARILAEQGVVGFLLWAGFIIWCVFRRTAFVNHPWLPARRLIWYWYAFLFVSSALGLGMLTAIPNTFLFLLGVGWTVVVPPVESPAVLSAADQRDASRGRFRPAYAK